MKLVKGEIMKPDCIENYTKTEIIKAINDLNNLMEIYAVKDEILERLQNNAYFDSLRAYQEVVNEGLHLQTEFKKIDKELKKKYGANALTKATPEEQKQRCDLHGKLLLIMQKQKKAYKVYERARKVYLNN